MKLQQTSSVNDLPLNLAEAESLLVKSAISQAGGNISRAAHLLGVHRVTIYRVLAKTSELKP